MSPSPLAAPIESLLGSLSESCQNFYADRLVSLAVFGSVGRGTPRPDSDIDFLLVVEKLPKGRIARMTEFQAVETAMQPSLFLAGKSGLAPYLSPILKRPEEVLEGSLLFLDMIEDTRFLYDRRGFLQSALEQFKARLDRLGARRIWHGQAWYWDLNPNYKWGDVFEL